LLKAAYAEDMVTEEWFDRIKSMPPADGRRIILDAIRQNVREMKLG
jgi:hypothetical protein